VCAGTVVTLKGTSNSPGTYEWSKGGVVVSSSTTTPNYALTATTSATSGTYTFKVTTADGCVSTATTDVVVNDIPNAPTITQPAAICDGSDLQIKDLHQQIFGGATYNIVGMVQKSYIGTD
jgi:hypothetical protein